jgi:hypothetical protein
MTFFDSLCPEHGGLSHLMLHEAAHAVAALDFGIPFMHVEVLSVQQWVATSRGIIGGGVWLVEQDPKVVVGLDPVAAMRFAMAGAVVEELALGHALEGSHEGDMRYWRAGAGLGEAQTVESLEHLLGAPLRDVHRDTQQWVKQHYQAIKAVATTLAGVTNSHRQIVDIGAAGRRLTQDEVAEIVQASNT